MTAVDLNDLPFQRWAEIFNWCLKSLKLENRGLTWDYDMDKHILYLSEKNVTIFLLKWS